MKVVVDTNVLFSAMLKEDSRGAKVILTEPGLRFFAPRFAIVEIFKYKEKIARASGLPED